MIRIEIFDFLVYFLVAETIGLVIFWFWFVIWRDKDRTFFLYFDTDKSCTIEAEKVKDGFVKFKKKYFYVDKTKPLIMQRSMGFHNPLLFLKWNDFIPIDVVRKTINPKLGDEVLTDPEYIKQMKDNPNNLMDWELEKFDKMKNEEKEKSSHYHSYLLRKNLTPETLKDVIDSKIASNLLKPMSSFDMILYIGIGLAIGCLLMFALISSGLLPLQA